MTSPLLYTYRRCPYAMRARMALLQAGVAYQAHELTSLRDKPAEMLALSPKGTVPVLVLPSGEVLEQSMDIMRWAVTQPKSIKPCCRCVKVSSNNTWTGTNTRNGSRMHKA